MRYLIVALLFLTICLALPPIRTGATVSMRVTWLPQPTKQAATPAPTQVAQQPHDDNPYPAPYPAPAKGKGKKPTPAPGLHCGRC